MVLSIQRSEGTRLSRADVIGILYDILDKLVCKY
jgi:hypothetical protein